MTRSGILRTIAVAAVASALLTACRTTLSGTGYGADSDPYLHERIIDPEAAGGDLVHRLVLIGDAGAPLPEGDPTLELLARWADEHLDRTTVLFLGDNVYPAGLRDSDRAEGERILRQQLEATTARKIFVPGNHDWGFAWNRRYLEGVLLEQQEFLDAWEGSDVRLEPREGCPGPVPVELVPPRPGLDGGLTLLLLDLHWWLLPEEDRTVCSPARTAARRPASSTTPIWRPRGRELGTQLQSCSSTRWLSSDWAARGRTSSTFSPRPR
jgi:hypothetical protein